MKKWIAIFMTIVCTLSLAACGSKQPTMDEVQQAIEAGAVPGVLEPQRGCCGSPWQDRYAGDYSEPPCQKAGVDLRVRRAFREQSSESDTENDRYAFAPAHEGGSGVQKRAEKGNAVLLEC